MNIFFLLRFSGRSSADVTAEQNTEEEAFEQLDYALSRGVNFIDTAEL